MVRGFQKGKPKTGGRQKGVINHDTRTFREIFEAAINKSIPEEAARLYSQANPELKTRILEKIMPYCYARMNTDIQMNVLANNVQINQSKVEELAKELIEVKTLSVEDL